MTDEMPQPLVDYWNGIRGLPDTPSLRECETTYEQTRKRINDCMASDKSACILLCRALRSACFEQLFSYDAA